MSWDVLMAQIVALRAQVESLASTVEMMRDHEPLPAPPIGCQHLDVENLGNFGAPSMRCRTCGQDVTELIGAWRT